MENCAAPEGETHAGRKNRRGRGRKRRSAIHARGKDEPGGAKSGARKNLNRRRGRRGWRRGTALQRRARCREARGAGRARCEERSEDKKEGEPRKDVTLKRSFAARQAPPIYASGAFASEDTLLPCTLTRRSAPDARAGRAPSARLRDVARKRAFTRIFPFRERHTPLRSSPSAHNVPRRRSHRAAQMPLERPLHRPG